MMHLVRIEKAMLKNSLYQSYVNIEKSILFFNEIGVSSENAAPCLVPATKHLPIETLCEK